MLLLLQRIYGVLKALFLLDQLSDPLADLLGHVLDRVFRVGDVQSSSVLIGKRDDFIAQVLESEDELSPAPILNQLQLVGQLGLRLFELVLRFLIALRLFLEFPGQLLV